jgi:hypothetical protein
MHAICSGEYYQSQQQIATYHGNISQALHKYYCAIFLVGLMRAHTAHRF